MAERVPVEPIEVEKKESELKDTVADMEVESKTKQSKWTKKEKAGTKGIIEKSEYKEEAEIAVAKSKELAKVGAGAYVCVEAGGRTRARGGGGPWEARGRRARGGVGGVEGMRRLGAYVGGPRDAMRVHVHARWFG